VFIGVALFIGAALLVAPFSLPSATRIRKRCRLTMRFNAFDDARMKFDVRFYLSRSCSLSSTWR